MEAIAFKTKDNASGQLNASITGSTLTIPLKAGEGANFPQPYNGTATSAGDRTTLNSTGIGLKVSAGQFIRNVTDGSIARVETIAGDNNSITTTRLKGGTDNKWDNADVWRVDEFVATINKITENAYGVKEITDFEKVLIIARTGDNLTVATGARGYDGSVAQAFDADDYVSLFVTSTIFDRFTDLISLFVSQFNKFWPVIEKAGYYAVATGSSGNFAITIDTDTGLVDGNIYRFKANHSPAGAVTLTITNNNGSLGSKDVKFPNGDALVAGDILNGGSVEVQYNSTTDNFRMLSGTHTPVRGVDTGAILMWTTNSAPSGWLFCAGQAVDRTTYAGLFSAISTTYGVGDGSTTFNLPDLRGRVPVGRDDMGGTAANRLTTAKGHDADTLGNVFGSEKHQLIVAEMPSHSHSATKGVGSANSGGVPDLNVANKQINETDNSAAGYLDIQATGGDGEHENVQPSIVLHFIIKT